MDLRYFGHFYISHRDISLGFGEFDIDDFRDKDFYLETEEDAENGHKLTSEIPTTALFYVAVDNTLDDTFTVLANERDPDDVGWTIDMDCIFKNKEDAYKYFVSKVSGKEDEIIKVLFGAKNGL